jgi:hypothetical protein
MHAKARVGDCLPRHDSTANFDAPVETRFAERVLPGKILVLDDHQPPAVFACSCVVAFLNVLHLADEISFIRRDHGLEVVAGIFDDLPVVASVGMT